MDNALPQFGVERRVCFKGVVLGFSSIWGDCYVSNYREFRIYIYKLNSIEIALITDLATSMNQQKEQRGIRSNRYDKSKTEIDLHVMGLSAEYAFSMLTGLQPDFNVTLHGDRGHDFVTKDGLTIELKYRDTRRRDFALVKPNLDGLTADIGVLMWPTANDSEYEFAGWTTRIHAARVGQVKRLLKDRFLVRWQDMLKPERFMTLL